jgi:hypothetical protein
VEVIMLSMLREPIKRIHGLEALSDVNIIQENKIRGAIATERCTAI